MPTPATNTMPAPGSDMISTPGTEMMPNPGAVMPTGAMMPGASKNTLMPGSAAMPANAGSYLNMELPMSQPMAGAATPTGSNLQGIPNDVQKNLAERQEYIQKQQRWLLFLRHCAKCQQGEDECQFGRSCKVGKDLWSHILSCSNPKCTHPRCTSSKDLLKHHQKCQTINCPICTPVKEYVRRTRTQAGPSGMPATAQPRASMNSGSGMPGGHVSLTGQCLMQEPPTHVTLLQNLPVGVPVRAPNQNIAARRSIVFAGLGFWSNIQALLKTPDAQAADTAGRQLAAALAFAVHGSRNKLPLVRLLGFMIGSLAVGAFVGAAVNS